MQRSAAAVSLALWLCAACPVVGADPPPVVDLCPGRDARRAVRRVRSNGRGWGLDPRRIGMVGFSAGGHLAVATATGFTKRTYEPVDEVDRVSCRPDFAIAVYSGYLKARDGDDLA